MPIDVPQNEKVEMGMLKECVLDVVKKGTMPIVVQQNIRELGLVIRNYTASSVEKTDILQVGVKRRLIINPMTEALHSVILHQLASLPRLTIKIPQPDKNAINLQCPILIPHRVVKILK